jgi:hypothetical protein
VVAIEDTVFEAAPVGNRNAFESVQPGTPGRRIEVVSGGEGVRLLRCRFITSAESLSFRSVSNPAWRSTCCPILLRSDRPKRRTVGLRASV